MRRRVAGKRRRAAVPWLIFSTAPATWPDRRSTPPGRFEPPTTTIVCTEYHETAQRIHTGRAGHFHGHPGAGADRICAGPVAASAAASTDGHAYRLAAGQ